ncbi:MAG: DUF1080 domain-containing protein [Verrucomicrobia bacterium]|nr:DUF1080 domain-containing protein [Verrucomicrobiota bacterium]
MTTRINRIDVESGILTREFHKLVAQILNLPYRRLAACAGSTSPNRPLRSTPGRLQVGDTADCKFALRGLGATIAQIAREISWLKAGRNMGGRFPACGFGQRLADRAPGQVRPADDQKRCLPHVIGLALGFALVAASQSAESDFRPLFSGRDLAGWANVNCAPNTFTVREGMIVSTGIPTGVLRTDRQYENFELELEWRHMQQGGNAGLFVWSAPTTAPGVPFTKSIEVQILDGRNSDTYTSHGDVFAIHGASFKPDRPHPQGWMRCLPSEQRANPAGEWNHYRVVCNNGDIKLAVNGKIVSGGFDTKPRKGYICLEAEGSECHFRNIRIRELPSSNPSPEEVAPLDAGFKSLYTGIDLAGWRQEPGHTGHWQPKDWILDYDGKSAAPDPNLWSQKEYGDFVLICDWRFRDKGAKTNRPVILPNGDQARDEQGNPKAIEVLDAGDSGIYLRGNSKSQVNIWCWPIGSAEVYGYRTDSNMPPDVRSAVTPKMKADKPIGQWNRFEITMKGDRLTVVLNEKTVIENARLPGVPKRGPIALQHHGDPVQFANLYIKELN